MSDLFPGVLADQMVNPYGQRYGTTVLTPPPSSITEAQGKLLLVLVAKQLDLLKSIERSLVILNRKMP